MEESTIGKKEELAKVNKKVQLTIQFDIEVATDLKKVLEEKIFNSKAEFTLGKLLGIAKREFHEEIIDIIKRKRQILGEVVHPWTEDDPSRTLGVQLQAKESNVATVGCYQSLGK
ncbi:hypothetical protein L7F22_041762 [Adiantum nelumboides]|nr:hypothetical protein [Adiantum nelumboides]